ncbi:low temperature requirement protein A [Cellulomonas hominis]
MVLTVGLRWAYFAELSGRAEHALARRDGADRARAATDGYTYLHLALVAGIVLAAFGLGEAMVHIADEESFGLLGAAALGGGVACYLAGTGAFARRVMGEWSPARLVGAAPVLAAVGLLAAVPPIVAVTVGARAVVVLLLMERATARLSAREVAPAELG